MIANNEIFIKCYVMSCLISFLIHPKKINISKATNFMTLKTGSGINFKLKGWDLKFEATKFFFLTNSKLYLDEILR